MENVRDIRGDIDRDGLPETAENLDATAAVAGTSPASGEWFETPASGESYIATSDELPISLAGASGVTIGETSIDATGRTARS